MRPKVTKAREQGRAAAWPGATIEDADELNPYEEGTVYRTAWEVGFFEGSTEDPDEFHEDQSTTLQNIVDEMREYLDRLDIIAKKCKSTPSDLSVSERMAILAIGFNIRMLADSAAEPILKNLAERSLEFDTVNQMIADIEGRH